jgi:hypothetical protein
MSTSLSRDFHLYITSAWPDTTLVFFFFFVICFYCRLITLMARDHAYSDLIHLLADLLRRSKIDLQTFLKVFFFFFFLN